MEINTMPQAVTSKVDTFSAQDKKLSVESVGATQAKAVSSEVESAKQAQIDEKVMAAEVEAVNDKLNKLGQGVTFSYDPNAKLSIVKLVDKSTDEVIKQYPSEDALKVIRNIQSYLSSVNTMSGAENKGLTGVMFNEII